MRSEMMLDNYRVTEATWRDATVGSPHLVAISQPDCWRYMVEVQDAGLPPDPTGYR